MKTKYIKMHFAAAQVLSFLPLAEFFVFGTFYSFVISFLTIALLGKYRCISCGTPGWDERVIGRKFPASPKRFDKCGVCGNSFGE
jgi:hypothetical protein